jgi:cellulose synthase/poly-beta-1,6-N-acetylglucosamine synthase-like glycosyltransferase
MTDSAPGSPGPGTVTIIVTVRDDPRLARALDSLLTQTLPPQEILIADGGSSPTIQNICEQFAARDPRIRRIAAPGTIAESRNVALASVRTEWVAFLDTDEVAPPIWLRELTAPFASPEVGFTGGPTPALGGTARNVAARFYDAYLRRFYDEVAREHPHALPMGNSAWRTRLFRELGPLDLSVSGLGNEDQEMALRAIAAGWHGVYVSSAGVSHDFSDLGWWTLFQKQRRYARGGYRIWRRTGATYEATVSRVLPFALLPLLGLAGIVLLAFPALRFAGGLLCLVGFGGLAVLALALTVRGRRLDVRFPGHRYGAVEIWRRWATIIGAFEGATRRMPPAPSPQRVARR